MVLFGNIRIIVFSASVFISVIFPIYMPRIPLLRKEIALLLLSLLKSLLSELYHAGPNPCYTGSLDAHIMG